MAKSYLKAAKIKEEIGSPTPYSTPVLKAV